MVFKHRFPFYIFIGFLSFFGQILLIRELATVFSGTELIYGLTIATWLVLFSIFSFLFGKILEKIEFSFSFFVSVQVFSTLILYLLLTFTRLSRVIFNVTVGSVIGIDKTLLIIFLSLLPATLLLGAQFILACKFYPISEKSRYGANEEEKSADTKHINNIYILEAVGMILSGVLFYFLFSYFNPFFVISFLGLFQILLILFSIQTRSLKRLLLLVPLFFYLFMIVSGANLLNNSTINYKWQGFDISEIEESPYGRIVKAKYHGVDTIYENGALIISESEDPEIEEVVHLSFAFRNNSKNILIISGNLELLFKELKKYGDVQIDYLVHNPYLIPFFEIESPQISCIKKDGIRFMRETFKKYDLILMNLPEPQTALINRYFTLESFKRYKKLLNPSGMLVFKLPGSFSFMAREMSYLNTSIKRTVEEIFPYVEVIPGNFNYFFASQNEVLNEKEKIVDSWAGLDIETKYFDRNILSYLLREDRLSFIKNILSREEGQINFDFKPISYYLTLMLWSGVSSPRYNEILRLLMNTKIQQIFLAIIFVFLAFWVLSKIFKKIAIPIFQLTMSFSLTGLQIIAIFSFQALWGYLYQAIGLLTMAFMAGLALGAFLFNTKLINLPDPKKLGRYILLALFFLTIVILLLFRYFPYFVYLPFLSLASGFCLGLIFPLSIRIYKEEGTSSSFLAGTIYSADLLGGAGGAFLASIFFIPIFGIINFLNIILLLVFLAFIFLL